MPREKQSEQFPLKRNNFEFSAYPKEVSMKIEKFSNDLRNTESRLFYLKTLRTQCALTVAAYHWRLMDAHICVQARFRIFVIYV